MSWGELAQLLTALGVLGTLVRGMLSDRRTRKDVADVKAHVARVEHATNGLSSRNEAIAQKLGVAEGKAQGLEQGREERRE